MSLTARLTENVPSCMWGLLVVCMVCPGEYSVKADKGKEGSASGRGGARMIGMVVRSDSLSVEGHQAVSSASSRRARR